MNAKELIEKLSKVEDLEHEVVVSVSLFEDSIGEIPYNYQIDNVEEYSDTRRPGYIEIKIKS